MTPMQFHIRQLPMKLPRRDADSTGGPVAVEALLSMGADS
jgi:hypothetical protein